MDTNGFLVLKTYNGLLPLDGEQIIIEIIQDNERLKKLHLGSADLNKCMITNILKGI
jgi:hypothetical protein